MLLGSIIVTAPTGNVENKLVTPTQMRLEIGTFCLISGNLAVSVSKALTHSHSIHRKYCENPLVFQESTFVGVNHQ